MKQVNVTIQMLATLFIPTGLYAFRRINKGKLGIGVYLISIGMPFLFVLFTPFQSLETCDYFNGIQFCKPAENIVSYTIAILILGILSFLIPMLVIARWSREFNEKLNKVVV